MTDSRDDLIAELRALILAQAREIEALKAANALLRAEIVELRAEIARLRGSSGRGSGPLPAPAWVKANRPRPKPKPRKGRDGGPTRKLSEPDEVVDHALTHCPECGDALARGWESGRREVIDLPVVKVRVIHHRIMRHRCSRCCKQFTAPCDLADAVAGRHRVSHRVMSLIGWLRVACRMPVRAIQRMLMSIYCLKLSAGAIVKILHDLAHRGEAAYQQLRDAVRGSPFVHADETGWREDGANGYLWSFSTPEVRYFERHQSRGHQVPEAALEGFDGPLVTDFYGGYNYHDGLHQRCWVHLLRDLQALKDQYPQRRGLARWVAKVKALYQRAKAFQSPSQRSRLRAKQGFEKEITALAHQAAQSRSPQATLAKRLIRFAQELFTFVEHPEVPSENNAAERAIRPAVILRKISGGTRSAKGSQTLSVLLSLTGTWQVRGQCPREQLELLLKGTAA